MLTNAVPAATSICPECASPLRTRTKAGLCPACLMKFALADQRESGDAGLFPDVSTAPRFGDYELGAELGRGGMGVVYEARQFSVSRRVALKMILPTHLTSQTEVERFRLEAETIASLDHPNILPVFDVGEFQGQRYFTMKLVEGGSLAGRADRVAPREAARLVAQVARAVHYAHLRGVQHRDLKPGNILVDAEGRPYVSDFGLARLRDRASDLTQSTSVLGSPAYMSPEQAAGDAKNVTNAADVYGLGAILFYLLTGRAPFEGETAVNTLRRVVEEEAVSPRTLNPEVDGNLATICLKGLRKLPGDRYISAEALAEDLENWRAGQPIAARPVSPLERLGMWCRRSPALAVLSLAFLVACIVGVAGILWQWHRAEQNAAAEQRQRRAVEASEERVRLNLYAADIKAASLALEKGDFGLALTLLEAHTPAPGATDERGFEWRFLRDQCHGQQWATLTGHQWIVTCAAFSPDGQWLATGSQDATVKIWNVTNQSLVTSFVAHTGAVWSVGFSRDGSLLVSAGANGQVVLRATGTWKETATFKGEQAVFSPTEDLIAMVDSSLLFWTPPGAVTLWNYQTHQVVRRLPGPGKRAAFSGDGRTLGVTRDKTVTLWDVASGNRTQELKCDAPVWSVALDQTAGRVAASGRGKAFFWNRTEPGRPGVLPHTLNVWDLAFSPDGKSLATVCSDRGLRLWDTTTLALTTTRRGHLDEIWAVAFSADGRWLGTGSKDTTVMLWPSDAADPRPPIVHTSWQRPFFSPDGKVLVTTLDRKNARASALWDVASGTPRPALPAFVAFSPDGRHEVRLNDRSAKIEWWSGRVLGQEIPLGGPRTAHVFERLIFADHGNFFAVAQPNGQTDVFAATTGELLRSWTGPPLPWRASVLSTNGHWLAVSTEKENVIRLLEVRSGQTFSAAGHKDFPSGLAFNAPATLLASGSMDGAVKLWALSATGAQEKATFKGHLEEATDVSFSPDGRTLVSLARHADLKFWHVPTRRELMTLEVPDAADHLQFSPDGSALAVTLGGDYNRTVKLFRAPLSLPR